MRRALVSVLVVVALAGAAACGTKDQAPGEARLTLGDGSAAAVKVGQGAWSEAHDGDQLRRGTLLRVSSGEAELDAAKGVVLRLRYDDQGESELELGITPVVRAGRLLVETAGSPASIESGGTAYKVAPRSAARVERSLASGVAVYRGGADLVSAGRRLRVSALREAAVPALGLVPNRAAPLRLDASHPWDIRFVGAAFDLTEQLDAGSAGFSAQVASLDTASLRSLLPGIPDISPALTSRRPGDQLVSAAIASVGLGHFTSRLDSVLAFHDEGAPWGLVVLDQAVNDQDRVVAMVREAISRWAARSGGLGAAVVVASPEDRVPTAPAASSGEAAVAPGPAATGPTTLDPSNPPSIPPSTPPSSPVTTPPLPPLLPEPTPPLPPTPIDDVLDAIGEAVTTPLVSGLG